MKTTHYFHFIIGCLLFLISLLTIERREDRTYSSGYMTYASSPAVSVPDTRLAGTSGILPVASPMVTERVSLTKEPILDKGEESANTGAHTLTAAFTYALGEAYITGLEGSLRHETALTITGIEDASLPRLNPGMVNVTGGQTGYRMLPHGMKFSRDITVVLPYDTSLLPPGFRAEEIMTYYYDEQYRSWIAIERDSVDTENRVVVSRVDHFTDFINAVIRTPEMPETQAYVPTTISDLKVADPLDGLPLLHSPSANNNGTANMEYPLVYPSGRQGMQPDLRVTYSSGGGNGWLGIGWDIYIPSISVDTRWGVPRYDQENESEVYLHKGEQLVTKDNNGKYRVMPHRTNQWERRMGGSVDFYPRVEESFDKIVRHGTSPKNYWWSVTDRNGVTYYYGKMADRDDMDPGSVLRDDAGNVAYWALTEIRDLNNNTVRYDYNLVRSSGLEDENAVMGRQLYLSKINYTGYIDYSGANPEYKPGPYNIIFNRQKLPREDVIISGRYGFKEVTDQLLCNILIRYDHSGKENTMTNYMFCMENNIRSDYKTRLTDIIRMDGPDLITHCVGINDTSLKEASFKGTRTHFDYYDRPSTNNMFSTQFKQEDLKSEGLHANFVTKRFNESDGRATALGATRGKNWSVGGTASVGVGPNVCMTTISAGGNFDYRESKNEGIITLIDLDGDGLADKVFKVGDEVFFSKHLRQNDRDFSFDIPRKLEGVSNFLLETSQTTTWGLQASAGASLSGGWPATTSTTSVYFADVNADGLPDLVTEEGILFNSLENGIPTFTAFSKIMANPEDSAQPEMVSTSAMEPCGYIIFDGQVDDSIACEIDRILHKEYDIDGIRDNRIIGILGLYSDFQKYDYAFSEDQRKLYIYEKVLRCEPPRMDPDLDAVKVWVAPRSGWININPQVALFLDNSERFTQSKYRKGVRYSIQWNSGNSFSDGHLISQHDSILWSIIIDEDDSDMNSENIRIKVQENDILFFRLQSLGNRSFDYLFGASLIEYENGIGIQDDYGENQDKYNSYQDFLLTGKEFFQAPVDGRIKIGGSVNTGSLNRNAELRIYHNENLIQNIKLTSLMPAHFINYEDTIKQYDSIKFIIVGDGNLNTTWSSIICSPRIEYYRTIPMGTSTYIKDTIYYDPVTNMQIVNKFHHNGDFRGSEDWEFINNYPMYYYMGQLFGALYRGWGQFVYNNNYPGASVTDPIDITQLKLDYLMGGMQPSQASDTSRIYADPHVPDPTRENLTASFDNHGLYNPLSNNTRWVRMVPNIKDECWVGYGNINYIYSIIMTNSRIPNMEPEMEDIIIYNHPVPVPLSGNTVTKTVRKQNRSVLKNYSHSNGIQLFPIGTTPSGSKGSNTILTDYMDLNGDRYPDILGEVYVQYSTPWGGIGKKESLTSHVQKINETSTYSDGNTYGASYCEPARVVSNDPKNSAVVFSGKGKDTFSGGGTPIGGGDGTSPPGGIGGGATLGTGTDHAEFSWLDINGDGLPDKITKDGRVALNIGYKFLPYEKWNYWGIRQGSSTNDALNFPPGGFNLAQASLSGGLSVSSSDYKTETMLMDFNGDGLPDQVSCDDHEITVRYNMGNGKWSTAETFPFSALNYGHTFSEAADLGLTAGFTFLGFFKFGIGVQSSPYNRTFNKDQMQWLDINGDGYIDFVTSDDEKSINIYYNQTGKTNLLKKVTNFTGSSVELDYEMPMCNYEQPQRNWLMSSVKTNDPYTPAGGAVTYTTFEYRHPHYNRFERMDYGFDTVITRQYNTGYNPFTLFRYTVEGYHNHSFMKRGKKINETIFDQFGHPYEETLYNVLLADLNSGEPIGDEDCPSEAFPLMESVIKNYYWGYPSVQITTAVSYEYDRYRNVIKYYNRGDTLDPDDDLYGEITYKSPGAHNLISLAERIDVKKKRQDVMVLRRRVAAYNSKGQLVKITQYNNNGSSITDLIYDAYGNLSRITFPPNHRNERMHYDYIYDHIIHAYPVQTSNVLGYTSTAEYDYYWGKPTQTTDINGNVIMYSYDHLGRLSSVKAPYEMDIQAPYTILMEYEPVNYGRIDIFNPADNLSRSRTYHYDRDNPQDPIMTYLLSDGWGRTVQTKKDATINGQDKLAVSGKILYDAFGRITHRYHPVEEALSSNAGNYNGNYDAGTLTQTSYDILDRPIYTAFPDPDRTINTASYEFGSDFQGRKRFKTTTTDGNGYRTSVYTDYRGLQTTIEMPGKIITGFTYNPMGELLSTTDPDKMTTTYNYDILGQCIERNHPDAGTDRYQYDLAGNLRIKQNQNLRNDGDRRIYYTYSYNQLSRIEYPNNPVNNVMYTYGLPGDDRNTAGRVKACKDASGSRIFSYGKLGELTEEVRTFILPEETHPYNFTMKYEYDSWNRIRSILYPDFEKVSYHYDAGGNLKRIDNNKGYTYLKDIQYDVFGQRTEMKYGNHTSNTYKYDIMQRLAVLTSRDIRGNLMQDISYGYDLVGNITDIKNSARNWVGGEYDYHYQYDELYRLVEASGNNYDNRSFNTGYKYTNNGRLLNKSMGTIVRVQNGAYGLDYDYQYHYTENSNSPEQVSNSRGASSHFEWDANGNMIYHHKEGEWDRRLTWDEENRLTGTADRNHTAVYGYDSEGERVWKISQTTGYMNINGKPVAYTDPVRKTLYASPYLVVTEKGYTKHYYNGGERFANRIGDGGLKLIDKPVNIQVYNRDMLDIRSEYLPKPSPPQALPYVPLFDEEKPNYKEDDGTPAFIEHKARIDNYLKMVSVSLDRMMEHNPYTLEMLYDMKIDRGKSTEVYYSHSDHLGSSNWMTDEWGEPVQYLQYLPYGELWMDIHTVDPARYTFSGKEKDEETGYHYFGARYYDSNLGIWLSVDPMAGMYPHQSPYAYCSSNPIMKFDPNGLTDYEVNGKTKKINDGVNNLKISVNQRQFNRLERKFNRSNGYENYRDKMSVKNGYTTTSSSGEFSRTENGTYTAPELSAEYHKPGSQSYSDWNNSNILGPWSEGMPKDATINGQTYVVPTNSDNYVNINDKGLLGQFQEHLNNQGKSYKFHPLGMQLSGETQMGLDALGRLANPLPTIPSVIPMPNESVKKRGAQRNIQNRIYHYRRENIIK